MHKQLVYAGLDSEYGRDLESYISKLVDARTQRVEVPATGAPQSGRNEQGSQG